MKKKFQNIFGYGGVIHLYMKVRGYPNLMGSWGVRKNKKLLKNSVKVFSSFKKVLHEKKNFKIFWVASLRSRPQTAHVGVLGSEGCMFRLWVSLVFVIFGPK